MEEKRKLIYSEYFSYIETLNYNQFQRLVIVQHLRDLAQKDWAFDDSITYAECCEHGIKIARCLKDVKEKTQELLEAYQEFHDLLCSGLVP